ncbi:MAG: metallophosphoesterase [Planctomycetes bacterium]|nr:metallophosphoesterase [Planctomycetota bacterium]
MLDHSITGSGYTFNRLRIRSSEYFGIDHDPYLEVTYFIPDNNFTFAHMTDIHLGSNWVPGHQWNEETAYPRFTDGLYELSRLAVKPDFLLVGGDIVEYSRTSWFNDYQSIVGSFYKQTGIPVYTVPGNHDRYQGATGNALCAFSGNGFCEDGLAGYRENLTRLIFISNIRAWNLSGWIRAVIFCRITSWETRKTAGRKATVYRICRSAL